MKIEIYKSSVNKKWFFHIKAANNEIIAVSEAYYNKADCIKTARLLKWDLLFASIKVQSE